jgi:hypothetical protein
VTAWLLETSVTDQSAAIILQRLWGRDAGLEGNVLLLLSLLARSPPCFPARSGLSFL